MNKKLITLILAAGIICTAAACTDKTPSGDDISNDTNINAENNDNENTNEALDPTSSHYNLISREEPYSLTSTNKEKTYIQSTLSKASFVALQRKNSPNAKNMNQVLEQAFVRHETTQNEMSAMLDDLFADETANTDAIHFPWILETSYELVRNDGRAISLLENVYYFAGGTHPSITTFSYNFDPATGKQITQVFYDIEGGNEALSEADNLLYTKLVEKYGEDTISYDYIQSSFAETLSDCWYFTENGIKIAISAGEIAPNAAGTFELELSKDELCDSAQKYFN